MVLFICMAVTPLHAIAKAESLEEGIEQLAIDISSQMKAKGIRKIAIDDFTDLNGYKSALGDFISEELVTNFYTYGAGNFEVVERRELARVLKEQELGNSGLLNKETIAKVGEVLGIDAIVTGSIAYLGRSVKVNARMLGVNDAKVFAATSQKIPKDEMVEALLSQSGRVGGRSNLTSSASMQVQSFDTVYQNDFLVARPTLLTKNEESIILNVEIQNKTDSVLRIACFDKKPNPSLVGNMGFSIEGGKHSVVDTTGIMCIRNNDSQKKKKDNYTEISPNGKTVATFSFKFGSKNVKSDSFSFNTRMIRHSGSGSNYSMFMIGIPDIRLQQLN